MFGELTDGQLYSLVLMLDKAALDATGRWALARDPEDRLRRFGVANDILVVRDDVRRERESRG